MSSGVLSGSPALAYCGTVLITRPAGKLTAKYVMFVGSSMHSYQHLSELQASTQLKSLRTFMMKPGVSMIVRLGQYAYLQTQVSPESPFSLQLSRI